MMAPEDHGKVVIRLKEYLENENLTMNFLVKYAGVQYTQLKPYMSSDIQRTDLDVLARICNALDCTIADIMEFVPPEQD